jgi:ectoine hydroxylase
MTTTATETATTTAATRAAVSDPYPSRQALEPAMIERVDPILHGPATGALSWHQRHAYQADGYLALADLFAGDELSAAREEAGRLRNLDELRGREEVITEPTSKEIRSIFDIHRLSEVFGRMVRSGRLLGIVRELLGGDVYVFQSRINYKPGFAGKEFYWHSDFETWHLEDGMPRMRAVSCSINLTDNFEFNGPLMIMPGSHQFFVSCVGATPEDHYKESLKKQEYGVPDEESLRRLALRGGIVAPKGPAGSATLFECNAMHGSNSNITPYPRINLFVVFNSVENRLAEPFCGLKPRPDFIANRTDEAPLQPA